LLLIDAVWRDNVFIDPSSYVVENGLDDDDNDDIDDAGAGPFGNFGNGEEAVAATAANPPRPFVVGLEENVDVVVAVAVPSPTLLLNGGISLDLLPIGVATPPSRCSFPPITLPSDAVTNAVVVSAAFVRDKATEEACSITRVNRTC
jgi:hypothetical protein